MLEEEEEKEVEREELEELEELEVAEVVEVVGERGEAECVVIGMEAYAMRKASAWMRRQVRGGWWRGGALGGRGGWAERPRAVLRGGVKR